MNEIPLKFKGKSFVHCWKYYNADGEIIGVVGRYQDVDGKKDVVPFFKRKGETWVAGIDLNPRLMFGLDKLATYPKNKAVFVVEGEKAATALQSMGICAVTSLGGSQAANKTDWTPLNGFETVVLMPDNDEPGEHYIKEIYQALSALEHPPEVKVLKLSGLPRGGDIIDWIQRFYPKWRGYKSLQKQRHEGLRNKLKVEYENAEPVPDEWSLANSSTSLGWEKPNEIVTKLPPVRKLLAKSIPEPYRLWLEDVSYRMQTPLDFAAISAIVITGSIVGSGCGIRPKRRDEWEVISNLWGACIGRPSVALKSPSMKEPMGMLERLQSEYGESFEQEKAGAEFDGLASKFLIENVKGQLTKAQKEGEVDPEEYQALKAEYMDLNQNAEAEPARRIFKTNETSVQSMTVLQNQNPRGLLTFRDELTALLVKWDREDGADERAYFLEGWNGNGGYTDYKIGRGLTEAPNICISLLGGIQPDKLRRYLHQALRGNNDGLMQRLQLAVWPDEPKDWKLVDTKPNKAHKLRAFDIMKTLAEIDFVEYGAQQGENDERPYFRFNPEAQELFNEWFINLQSVKIQQEDSPLMVEHFGKFRSLMPSLALIFHCIDIADGKAKEKVTAESARLAISWCRYLESHARRIYAMAESPEHEAAVRLTAKIKAKALPNPFTVKTVYDKGWHGLKDKQEVEAACNILIDENWLRMTRKPPTGNRGRPPLPEYQINPILH